MKPHKTMTLIECKEFVLIVLHSLKMVTAHTLHKAPAILLRGKVDPSGVLSLHAECTLYKKNTINIAMLQRSKR